MVSRFLTLHHPADSRRFYEQGLWRNETMYGLLARHAAERPDAIALVDGTRKLSWKALQDWIDGVALDLRTYGLNEGDRVSIWMSNRLEAIVTFLACAREGFACNPSLHRTHTCSDIATLLERLSAKALVTEPHWGADWKTANLDATLAGIQTLRVVYTLDTFPRPAPNMTSPSDGPRQGAVPCLHLGHHGLAQMRHALAQQPARQRARSRARLGARFRQRDPHAIAALASHRLGRARAMAVARLPARDRRSAGE